MNQVRYKVSPDLNPMNYSVWDSLIEKVYAGRTEKFTEQELNYKIEEKRDKLSVAKIYYYISSWKKRLRLVDSEDGGNIDYFSIKAVISKF